MTASDHYGGSMNPQKIPLSSTLAGCVLRLVSFATVLLICQFTGNRVFAQSLPVIDVSTLRIESGTHLTFQFQGTQPDPGDFTIEVATSFASNGDWTLATQAVVTAVSEGIFRVSLALAGDRMFCRVRTIDSGTVSPPIYINEVMSDNVSTFAELGGGFYDWIELFNPNDNAVDLNGYALSDDEAVAGKWRFPSVFIPAQGHLVVFASDLNRTNAEAQLHTNFRLSSSGETLTLSDAALRLVDRFQFPSLAPDQSIGRVPDGSADFQFFAKADATPGAENENVTAGPVLIPPTFSPEGGFFDGPVPVQISGAESNHIIRFTLDGSAPTPQSPILSSNLVLTKSTVVRVLALNAQGHRSAPEARTYFVGVNHSLPIVSLATSPTNMAFRNGYLYGMGPSVLSAQNQVLQNYPYSGSYAWMNREVEIAIEFYETNHTLGFRQRAGMKVFGGWGSRGYPQKSLALFARRSYGAGKFDHPIFPGLGVNEFESFVLRNSGNDNQSTHQTPPRPPISNFGPTLSYGSYFANGTFTMMRDAMMQRLIEDDTPLDTQAYRPAVVYLNGEYWGMYNLREKTTEDYVISHHNLAPGSIDLIEGYGTVNAGSGTVYSQMRTYVNGQNMALDTNYAHVAENYLDIDNFIDYHLAVIYFQNFDIGNIKCWRPRLPRGRFRWIVYDQDYGFGLWPAAIYEPAMARDYADYNNMFKFYTAGTGTSSSWPNGGAQTLLLRNLLKNARFKEQFIRRCADLLNTAFREDRVEQTIQDMAAVIRPEIGAHLQRWNWTSLTNRGYGVPHKSEYQSFTPETWETNINVLLDFGRGRPAKLRQDCIQHFLLVGGLGTVELQVEPAGAGRIAFNSLTLDQLPWQGIYFGDITNTVRPLPNPGYRFVEWTTPGGTTNRNPFTFRAPRDRTSTITARMEAVATNVAGPSELLISEIQFHPSDAADSGDWIELHNPGTNAVNLNGWILRDDDDAHAFPLPDQLLQPGASLVLCEEGSKFRLYHAATVPVAGSFDFGLNNSGDTLRLYRPDGTLALAITYDDVAPWPTQADGTGYTLQLISKQSDPALPASWRASANLGGNPGQF